MCSSDLTISTNIYVFIYDYDHNNSTSNDFPANYPMNFSCDYLPDCPVNIFAHNKKALGVLTPKTFLFSYCSLWQCGYVNFRQKTAFRQPHIWYQHMTLKRKFSNVGVQRIFTCNFNICQFYSFVNGFIDYFPEILYQNKTLFYKVFERMCYILLLRL